MDDGSNGHRDTSLGVEDEETASSTLALNGKHSKVQNEGELPLGTESILEEGVGLHGKVAEQEGMVQQDRQS